MMNIVALCLLVTSLTASGMLSPSDPNTENKNHHHHHHQDNEESVLVVKEGLRVIVVEYDNEGIGKTKVSISPQPEDHEPPHHAAAAAADKIHNVEIDEKIEEEKEASPNDKANARELICDAFGKCKVKIASAFTKPKAKAHEVEEEVKDVVFRKAQEKKECAEDVVNKAKEGLKTAETAAERVRDVVKDKAKGGLETAETTAERVKDVVNDTAKEGLETAETAAGRVKDVVKDKAKGGKETAETAAEKFKDMAKEGQETAQTTAGKVNDMVKNKENTIEHQIRRVCDFAHDALTYVVVAISSSIGSLLGILHLLGFAIAYGMSVWITFVSSYVLAAALPRQQFGMLQSKIYPLYFKAMAYSIGVALLGHLLSQRAKMFDSNSKAEIFQGYNLIASLLMVFANLVYLEPRAAKVMFERMKVEKEEGRGSGRDASSFLRKPTGTVTSGDIAAVTVTTTTTSSTKLEAAQAQIIGLKERLRQLNSFSSTLNILTLISLTWHLVYLGQRLHMSSCH